ncbi:GerMN domain-containing protein [Proteinivorax tanatarense]|uniref:GerMN domain-containing protein n=1 Tax=Proteinivorax tanatarense TaxID=1260629 RepID=A0AAU7VI89_9FIRM
MKIRLLLIGFLVLLITLGCGGCLDRIFGPVEEDKNDEKDSEKPEEKVQVQETSGAEDEYLEIDFYVVDDTTEMLLPVTITYPRQEGIAQATVTELVQGSEISQKIGEFNLSLPLPEGTEVLGISISDKTAVVDFNEKLLSFEDKNQEKLAVTSIVYTLTQYSSIDKVQIRVNGNTINELTNGTKVSLPISRGNLGVNVSVEDEVDLKNSEMVTVYYPILRNETNLYIPVTKVVNSSTNQLKTAVSLYLGGTDFSKPFEKDVEIIKTQTKENVAVVSLSQEFISYPREIEEGVVESLILTVTEIERIDKVQLLVEGHPKVLPAGTDLNNIMDRPAFAKIN